MMPATVSGTRLNSPQPGDIKFLSSFFTDLNAILAYKRVNPEWRGLHSAGCTLAEALNSRNVQKEPRTSQQDLDSDTEDETWVQDWEVQQLLEWVLLEVRATGLPEERHELQHLVERLEERLTTTPDTSSESQSTEAGSPEPAIVTIARGEPEQHCQSNPISLIPTELFHNIFEFVCAPRSLALFSPLILSHVNSHFRSIVLDMSSLWNTIDDAFPLPIAKLYLERCIGAPLDIRIGSNGPPAPEDGKWDELFQCLEPHAHRVKVLKIVTDDEDAMDDLEELMCSGGPFDDLEKLEFGLCGNSEPNDRDLMFALDKRGSLQELHLWGYTLGQWIDTFPTALRRLWLSEVCISLMSLTEALERPPDLSVLVLEDCLLYGYGDAAKVVTLGGLVDLQFIRIVGRDIIRLTSLIRTPALASFSVAAAWSKATPDFLVNLVENSKEILSAEICAYDLTRDEWFAIFKHLPRLTHLRIRASNSSDEDLEALIVAQTLPNLKSITLDNELRLTTQLVEDMVRAHPKLESVALRGWDPSNVSTESLALISKLVKNIFVETFRRSPEDDCDEETESDTSNDFSTDGSWLSGDEHVVIRDDD
ncbi:hypothetical protein M407DRAFT_195844 [Tulasnella calospora MUT 4182]|uniref:F-box domain-containing protein n=1 Tax=Tulasnella calospora MUT 4182 TaxID=1051891 RepID=A0A0C3LZY1_9AGAM|nr:hypothetical protein M407DRAFT_195844 [Tulasnella calospora MUT 4182]